MIKVDDTVKKKVIQFLFAQFLLVCNDNHHTHNHKLGDSFKNIPDSEQKVRDYQ